MKMLGEVLLLKEGWLLDWYRLLLRPRAIGRPKDVIISQQEG
jgi:hypothetical protein